MPNLTDNPGFAGNNNSESNQNTSGKTTMEDILKAQTEYLKSIDETLKRLLKEGRSTSQSAARDRVSDGDRKYSERSSFKNAQNRGSSSSDNFKDSGLFERFNKIFDGFFDEFESELQGSFKTAKFSDEMKKRFESLAKDMGTDVDGLPKAFGKILGQKIRNAATNSRNPYARWMAQGTVNAERASQNISDRFVSGYDRGVNRWRAQNPRQAAVLQGLREQQAAKEERESFKSSYTADRTREINEEYAAAASAEAAQPVNIVGAEVAIPIYNAGASDIKKAGSVTQDSVRRKQALEGLGAEAESAADAKFREAPSINVPMFNEDEGLSAAQESFAGILGGIQGALGNILPDLLSFSPQMLFLSIAVKGLTAAAGPAVEGLTKLSKTAAEVADRAHQTENEMRKNAQERIEADIDTLVREPFNILKDAASKLYDAWDSSIRKINQTQGYSKEDLQNLISAYAQQLRDEGLSSVVSSADITTNLANVLSAGLSGEVAEEFAYLATKLNAAIPTQDFFQYASAYSSLAATAIQNGASQSAAIQYANEQLEAFASNILYASRQISGGFSTGLQNANDLFEKSVKIAQTGRSTNVTEISGVMASVSAIVGAVAPDLATSLTDIIYEAATGGNTSQLVALRSLAGINASNTEFLKEFTSNPQSVFSQLFSNLANLQQMSSDNYMEVAEGLSSVFGVSMDALARVDFNYLAQAISAMNVNSNALDDNLNLLASGESTTTAEQLRMQQINQYMIDEGLAYVLDNEAARAIQQHMWDEQIANELQEATYGIELQGASADALLGIKQTVENIISFLIPFIGIGKAITSLVTSNDEANALQDDIVKVLEAGKVGQGNKQDLYNLTTREKDLQLTDDLITLMGGVSSYAKAQSATKASNAFWSLGTSSTNGLLELESIRNRSSANSMYDWGMVGKSLASSALGGLSGGSATGSLLSSVSSATSSAQAKAKSKLDRYISTDYMQQFVDDNKSFNDYYKAANKALGNFDEQLEEAEISKTDLEQQFQSLQTQKGAKEQQERNDREEAFWKNTQDHLLETIDLITYQNELLEEFYQKHSDFYDAWVDYFVKHTAYSAAYSHTDVTKVQLAEKSGSEDAVYALADALTKNTVDLLDPTVQTNAILSQILIVVNAIMQQNNKTGTGLSLPDTLSGLALGIVKQT